MRDYTKSQTSPLESVLMRKLNINYSSARNLVADGRAIIHMKKHDSYTPELEAVCLNLFQGKFGPVKTTDISPINESTTDEESRTNSFSEVVTTPIKPAPPSTKKESSPIIKDEPVADEEGVFAKPLAEIDHTEDATETDAPSDESVPVKEAKSKAVNNKDDQKKTKKVGLFGKLKKVLKTEKTTKAQ